jgi:6-phospho-3-hexuloisomerase
MGDIFLVASGSGSTPTVLAATRVAKERGLHISLITATSDSPIARISDSVFIINAPRRNQLDAKLFSIQPMTTLFEQSLAIFLDSMVLDLMAKLGETTDTMWSRHNSIE